MRFHAAGVLREERLLRPEVKGDVFDAAFALSVKAHFVLTGALAPRCVRNQPNAGGVSGANSPA
jgi:hypothetical protein